MTKNRIKIEEDVILTRDEAEKVLNELARYSNDKRIIVSDMDEKLLAIKDEYQPLIIMLDSQISGLTRRLETWANMNSEIFPKDKKSLKMMAGTIGYRFDTPSIHTINRSVTWAKVLAELVKKRWRKFVRVKMEVDKDAILKRCGTLKKPTKFQSEILPTLGLKLVQEEKFYVEPNLTETEGAK